MSHFWVSFSVCSGAAGVLGREAGAVAAAEAAAVGAVVAVLVEVAVVVAVVATVLAVTAVFTGAWEGVVLASAEVRPKVPPAARRVKVRKIPANLFMIILLSASKC